MNTSFGMSGMIINPPLTKDNRERKRLKRACGFCRDRKRKCDGNMICSNCIKNAERTQQPPNCEYEPEGRGTMLTKAVLARLEAMESVLNSQQYGPGGPIASESSSTSLDFRLAAFLDQSELFLNANGQPQLITPVSSPSLMQSHQLRKKSKSTGDEASSSVELDGQMLPLQRSLEFSMSVYRRDLIMHLLDLSQFAYVGYCVDSQMCHVPVVQRGAPLSDRLEKALCFRSIFISSHPLLFNGNPNPNFAERLAVANNFRLTFAKEGLFGNTHLAKSTSNVVICDELRSNLIQSLSVFAIGETVEAYMILCSVIVKAKTLGLFAPETFLTEHLLTAASAPASSIPCHGSSAVLTGDQLMSMIPSSSEIVMQLSQNLTDYEKQERLALVTQMLFADTFATLAKGTEMMIDESLFPDLRILDFSAEGPITPIISRKCPPSLAQNTIWKMSPFAFMLDDQRESSRLSLEFPNFSMHKSVFSFNAVKVFRKIIRFIRSNKSFMSYDQIKQTIAALHMEVLGSIHFVPESLFPFINLQSFLSDAASGNPLPGVGHFSRASSEVYLFLFMYLGMLSYLHLPASQLCPDSTFPLTLSSTDQTPHNSVKSKDVLYAALKALEFISHSAYTPIYPEQSTFDISADYPLSMAEETFSQPLNSQLPSPMFACSTSSTMSFLICSSAMIVFRASLGDSLRYQEICKIVRETVYPCVSRIGSVFPVASIFAGRLLEVLGGGGQQANML